MIIGDGKAASNGSAESVASESTTAGPETDTSEKSAATEPLPSPSGAVYLEIPIDRIEANPKQPRQVFDEEALGELVHSIREFGLMQPIVVRRTDGDRFQLIMGERRWRAAQQAELQTISAIVRDTDDNALLRDALLENIHRVQLNPLEEAAAYQQLLEEFEVTHEELAARIGRSRPVVTNMIRLLKLPIAVQRRVAAGVLSAGHARALLSLDAGADARRCLPLESWRKACRCGPPRKRLFSRIVRDHRTWRLPGGGSRSRCPDCRTSPNGCRRRSIPASPSASVSGRARSWWNSGRSTISSAS